MILEGKYLKLYGNQTKQILIELYKLGYSFFNETVSDVYYANHAFIEIDFVYIFSMGNQLNYTYFENAPILENRIELNYKVLYRKYKLKRILE